MKIVPVMTQTPDKTRIELFTIKRSKKKAVEAIIQHLQTLGVGKGWLVSVGHGGAPEAAVAVLDQIRHTLSEVAGEILQLSPSLITHGGPGCITVQAVQM